MKDEWQTFVYMVLAIAAVVWIVVLFGCAGPEPVAPIAPYRSAYGFPP